MHRSRVIQLLRSVVIAFLSFPGEQSVAGPAFEVFKAAPGITTYISTTPQTTSYIHQLELSAGANFFSVVGPSAQHRAATSAVPVYQKTSLTAIWKAQQSDTSAYGAVNGQFYWEPDGDAELAGLSFAVRDSRHAITNLGNAKASLLLTVSARGCAAITKFSKKAVHDTTITQALAGLEPTSTKVPHVTRPRTYAGIKGNGTNCATTLLFFQTTNMFAEEAAEVFREFGATQMLMLDGGNSTQSLVLGETLIWSFRKLPHFIVLRSGPSR